MKMVVGRLAMKLYEAAAISIMARSQAIMARCRHVPASAPSIRRAAGADEAALTALPRDTGDGVAPSAIRHEIIALRPRAWRKRPLIASLFFSRVPWLEPSALALARPAKISTHRLHCAVASGAFCSSIFGYIMSCSLNEYHKWPKCGADI